LALRVLHCPANVGNHPQGLARAERRLGVASWCVDVDRPWLDYPIDEALAPPTTHGVGVELRRWRLLLRALRDYDVVHFNFGRSLLPARTPSLWDGGARHVPGRLYGRVLAMRDVPLLKRAGKRIFVTFQGDDARQAYGPDVPHAHRWLGEAVGGGYYTAGGDALKRRTIARWDAWADGLFYVNPDLGAFLPARASFTPYASVDPEEWRPATPAPLPRTPTIVHAPSHRGIKGTQRVVDAVERLRREGVDLDFRLVENLPHTAAREAYESADVLVDQVLVGWYGGLAVEFMALGKPVVCFIDDESARRYAPPELIDDLPVLRAQLSDPYSALRELLTSRRDEYENLSLRSRAFVEKWHDPVPIAARMRDAYESAFAVQRPRMRA